MDNIFLLISYQTEVDKWIAERHYLKSTPPGARLRFFVMDSEGEIIGAMMWGRPTSRMLDKDRILELTRMHFIDKTDPFVESKSLSMARKLIRKGLPGIKGLLAYASTGKGHEGTIYKADNWFQFGKTKGGKWTIKNRKRADRDISPKIRWLRSP